MHTALCFLVANSTTTVAVALELTQLHWNWAVCVCVYMCLVCMCLRHVLVAVDTFNAADVLCTEHHVAQGLILVRKHQRSKPVRQIGLEYEFRLCLRDISAFEQCFAKVINVLLHMSFALLG